jgi:NADH-quinone oxidoreductase subunit D
MSDTTKLEQQAGVGGPSGPERRPLDRLPASEEGGGVTITRDRGVEGEVLTVNFGPQHPSTHGVLRLVVDLDGEVIRGLKPVIGYLHTGIEKQMEALRWQQGVVVTDRHDYLSPPINNLAYALAVERLMGVEVPPRAQGLRVIMSELTRIASHLVWLGTSALELGAMGVMFYAFRERDKILDLNEEISGYRMHTSYIRPGGVMADATPRFLDLLDAFIREMPANIDEYENLLTHNPIWVARTKGIGYLSAEDAIAFGATGPMLRGSGVRWDLRKERPYCGFETYDWEVPVEAAGDCYARYLVRIREMRESVKILRQALDRLPGGPVNVDDRKMLPPPREELDTSMEAVIHHFKLFTEGYSPPPGDVYVAVESGRGENGCYIVSDGTHKPRRVKFRSTSFVHLQALEHMAMGSMVADLIAIIGTADTILGDVDR